MSFQDDNKFGSPPLRIVKRRRTCLTFGDELLSAPESTCAQEAQPVSSKSGSSSTMSEKETVVASVSASSTTTQDQQSENYTVSQIQRQVAQAAQRVFRGIGCGFSESVYRDALCVELQHSLQSNNAKIDREVVYPVRYCGRYVGMVRADIVLDTGLGGERIVIELKTTSTPLTAINARQLLTYLRLENVCRGVLINFEQRDLVLADRVSSALSSKPSNSAPSSCTLENCIVDDSAQFRDGDDPDRCVCGHKHVAKVLFLVHSAAAKAKDELQQRER